MINEFNRFGLEVYQRILTGLLQLLGSIGILIGLLYPWIGMAATAGLSLLMLLGFGVRLKVRDSIKASLPSFLFMIINAYLFLWFFSEY